MKAPLVTNPIIPLSPILSLDQRIALIYESDDSLNYGHSKLGVYKV